MEKIAILGAESTGKTSLCHELAQRLNSNALGSAQVVPEQLRIFCELHQRTPAKEEQIALLRQQILIESETEKSSSATWLLCDCAPLTTALYSEMYFNDSSLLNEAQQHHRTYDKTLVLAPTLDWQADGIFRDSPDAQAEFHERLLHRLNGFNQAFELISSTGEHRIEEAWQAIMRHR